jgi:hypothetical protein
MKHITVYPLAKAADQPKMEFLNGSGKPIDTVHSDTITFFEMLAQLVDEEPAEVFTPLERFYMQAVGIEKGKPFNLDPKTRKLLSEAAHSAAAMARANTFASRDSATYYYKDRKWQYVGDVPYTFVKDGVLQVDLRAYVYYMAIGNSPAMMSKNVGLGSGREKTLAWALDTGRPAGWNGRGFHRGGNVEMGLMRAPMLVSTVVTLAGVPRRPH